MNGYEKNAGGVGQDRPENGQGEPKRGFGYSAKPMSRFGAVRANLAARTDLNSASIDRVEERLFDLGFGQASTAEQFTQRLVSERDQARQERDEWKARWERGNVQFDALSNVTDRAVARLEGERDQARELADQADGYLRRAEIAEGRAEAFRETILEYAGQLTDAIEQRDAALDQLAKAEEAMLGNAQQREDARAERDAAAENARRERDRHGTYDDDQIFEACGKLRETRQQGFSVYRQVRVVAEAFGMRRATQR